MEELKKEYYRLLDHLEAAQEQLDNLEYFSPIIGPDGPMLPETEIAKERARKVVSKLLPQLTALRDALNA